MISFVFYAHSKRIDNLKQTLYCLSKREPIYSKSQKIVVFQDPYTSLDDCEIYNLKLQTYNKPKMCNFGVSKATFPIVALLDSDRILPPHYFTENAKVLNKNQMVTAKTIVKMRTEIPYNFRDYQGFSFFKEERSFSNEFRKKNLFSGNTLFFANVYKSLGGMDEKYVGYGYADNDMTENAIKNGIEQVYRPLDEIHLHHEQSMCYNDAFYTDYQIFSALNIMRFCVKWKRYDFLSEKVISEAEAKLQKYPSELQVEFLKQKTRYIRLKHYLSVGEKCMI